MEIEIDEPFDVDNMDVQEQMEELENEEEAKKLEKEMEHLEDIEHYEIEKAHVINRHVLNIKNIKDDLGLLCEDDRAVYTFKSDGVVYTGYVVHQMTNNFFIFNVHKKGESKKDMFLKKFDINKIKQVK